MIIGEIACARVSLGSIRLETERTSGTIHLSHLSRAKCRVVAAKNLPQPLSREHYSGRYRRGWLLLLGDSIDRAIPARFQLEQSSIKSGPTGPITFSTHCL